MGGDSTTIWFVDGAYIYELSVSDFSVVRQTAAIHAGEDTEVGGSSDVLWLCSVYGDGEINELSVTDFSVIQTVASPNVDPEGIGGDSSKIWLCDAWGDQVYELDAASAGIYLLRGTLRVVGTEEQYGDGFDFERDIEGELTGETGTPRAIGYGDVVHRYCDEDGNIHEFEGDFTGESDTVGKIGYEEAGTHFRYIHAGGGKKQYEGALA